MKIGRWWPLVGVLVLACVLISWPKEHCAEDHDPGYTLPAKICTDKETYDCGEPTRITFTITNVSGEDIVLDGGREPALDLIVYFDNEEIHWSDGQDHTSDLTVVTLAPGETRTISWVWPVSEAEWEALGCADRATWDLLHATVAGTVRPLPGASRRGPQVNIRYRGGFD